MLYGLSHSHEEVQQEEEEAEDVDEGGWVGTVPYNCGWF